MTAATEDLLAAQTRTAQTRPVPSRPTPSRPTQSRPVEAGLAQSRPAQAHVVQAGIVQAGTVRTYQIFIRATPQEIWAALTRPGWSQLYGYRAPAQYEMRPGGAYRAFASVTMKLRGISGVIFDGEIGRAHV